MIPPLILLFQALVSHSGSKNFSHDHTWPVLTGVGGDISGAKQQYPLSVHVCKHPRLDYLDSLHTHLVFHNIKKRRSFSIKIDYIMENKYSVVVIVLTSLLLLLRSVWTVPQSRCRWKLDLSSHNLNKFHFYHSNTPARLDPCKFNSNHWRKHVFLTLWNLNSFVSILLFLEVKRGQLVWAVSLHMSLNLCPIMVCCALLSPDSCPSLRGSPSSSRSRRLGCCATLASQRETDRSRKWTTLDVFHLMWKFSAPTDTFQTARCYLFN